MIISHDPSMLTSAYIWAITTIVMIMNFIGYTLVPELKNSHGLAIRCYIVTYIIPAVIYFGILFLPGTFLGSMSFFTASYIVDDYCNASCALWLQVISFDVWWAFRNLGYVDRRVKKRNDKKFMRYALYAWLSPAFLIASAIIARKWFLSQYHILRLQFCINTVIYGMVSLCNIFFYISMLCTMRRRKKETAALTEGSNRRHGARKQWMNLYVKLSLVMGIHMVTWVFTSFWMGTTTTLTIQCVYLGTELVHSISIFLSFVWKDSVQQALWERFRRVILLCPQKAGPISVVKVTDVPPSHPQPDDATYDKNENR